MLSISVIISFSFRSSRITTNRGDCSKMFNLKNKLKLVISGIYFYHLDCIAKTIHPSEKYISRCTSVYLEKPASHPQIKICTLHNIFVYLGLLYILLNNNHFNKPLVQSQQLIQLPIQQEQTLKNTLLISV
jgi:hypothetical protein